MMIVSKLITASVGNCWSLQNGLHILLSSELSLRHSGVDSGRRALRGHLCETGMAKWRWRESRMSDPFCKAQQFPTDAAITLVLLMLLFGRDSCVPFELYLIPRNVFNYNSIPGRSYVMVTLKWTIQFAHSESWLNELIHIQTKWIQDSPANSDISYNTFMVMWKPKILY